MHKKWHGRNVKCQNDSERKNDETWRSLSGCFCSISNLVIYGKTYNCQGTKNSEGHSWSIKILLGDWDSQSRGVIGWTS